jgi:hypothetical protein
VQDVMDGDIDGFISAYLRASAEDKKGKQPLNSSTSNIDDDESG